MWSKSINVLQGKGKSLTAMTIQRRIVYMTVHAVTMNLTSYSFYLMCKAATSKEQWAQSLPKLFLLLTNMIPPLHFVHATCFPHQLAIIWYLSMVFLNDWMWFHDEKLPFHNLCPDWASCSFCKWWLEQCSNEISRPITDTSDFQRHCYLWSCRMLHTNYSHNITTNREYFTKSRQTASIYSSRIWYLANENPAGVCSTEYKSSLPLHVTVMHEAPYVLFFLDNKNSRIDYQQPVLQIKKGGENLKKKFSLLCRNNFLSLRRSVETRSISQRVTKTLTWLAIFHSALSSLYSFCYTFFKQYVFEWMY